jgi:hypothetical protein
VDYFYDIYTFDGMDGRFFYYGESSLFDSIEIAYFEEQTIQGKKTIHSIFFSVAQPLERGINNYYSIIQGECMIMRKNIVYIGLAILLCLSLSACNNTNSTSTSNNTNSTNSTNTSKLTTSSSETQETEITLYANFAGGCERAAELDLIKTKTVTVEEVTAETIAQELSQWSGLDFTLNGATMSESILTVDWSADSTLIANLDDREQKEDFNFFDVDSMRWFMMDSLSQTCMENMGLTEVYYTMDGGKELSFEELYPISVFPKDVPYMSSPFYFAHADVKGDVTEEDSNIGDMEGINIGDMANYPPTAGTWRLYGAPDTAYIEMDGKGLVTTFYANGAIENDGYLIYYGEDEGYKMFNFENTLLDRIFILSENELVLGCDGTKIYKKD